MDWELSRTELFEGSASLLEQAPSAAVPQTRGGERSDSTLREPRGRSGVWTALKRTLAGDHALAILDQVVVSGTRFVTSIIVGRACGPHELGDYTLGFTLDRKSVV